MIDGPASLVWQQAANRMHAVRALLAPLDLATEERERLMATLGKPQRQHRIARLLEDQAVSSQAQLVELLAADGIVATQATVSRDLEDLGAVKVRIPGGTMAYAIPEHAKEASAPTTTSPGDGRVRGRRRAQRQPRRPAHAAGVGARGRVGARPLRPARRARHGRRRRHRRSWSVPRAPAGRERRVELATLAGL